MARPRVPEPLRPQVSPAQLLVLPILVVGYIFGVIQYGWLGFLIVSLAALLGVGAALWSHSINLEAEAAEQLTAHSDQEVELNQLRDDLEATEERAIELEASYITAVNELEQVRAQIALPVLNLKHLQHSLDTQIQVVDLTQKHRGLAADGLSEWPALSVTLTPDQVVAVVAHVEPSADPLAGEPITMINAYSGVVGNGFIAFATGQQVTAHFGLDAVPEIGETLANHGHVEPDPYSLRLMGLTFSPWIEMDDEHLVSLREKLRELSRTLTLILAPPGGDAQQLEIEPPPEEREEEDTN